MSELIAEARVLVTPDTTKFRSLLITEVAAAAKGVVVPVTVTPVVAATGTAGAAALAESQAQIAASTAASTVALESQRAAVQRVSVAELEGARASQAATAAAAEEAAARKAAAVAAAEQTRTLGGLGRGAGSAAASLVGVRGATLAATGPFIAGAAAAISLSKAIGIATSFNQQLSVFAATTGATADEMDRVSASAQQLGKDLTLPGVSAGDAAEAMTEFAKAGLSVNDAIAATRGGLQLATAAQLSNADAVELTSNALNAFKLSGDQAVSVADTLANAANAAQGSIADIGLGLKQAAGAAAVVGVSFKDTTALLTLLAKNGLTASDAGTSLRTAFIRLVNPSKQAQTILKDLNIQLRDAQGNVRPEVFAEFADAQKNLAVSTQQANAAIVFGQDAFRAFGVLSREGASGLQNVRTELAQTGTAAKLAGARMTGVAGATANLKNQLESLGLVVGEVTSGPLAAILTQLAEYAGAAQVAIVQSKNLGVAIGGIADSVPAGGFLVDVSKTAFKFGNIVGQLNIAKNLLQRGGGDVSKQADKTGVEIRDAIEEASRQAARGAVSFGDQITGALDDAFALINQTLAQAAKNFRSGQFAAVARAGGQQAGLEEAFNQIVAGGGSDQQQIANLKRQAAIQAKIIEEAGPGAAGDLLKARRAAQEQLASINSQIVSIEKGIAADQQRANDEIQRVRQQARRAQDQAFLQAQEDARTASERLVTRASDTPQITDDLRRQQQLRELIKRQIEALKASAVDEQTKQDAVRALRKARDATTDEIKRLRAANKDQLAQERQDAIDQITENLALRTQIAEARGVGTSAVVQRIDAQIKDAQKAQARAKKGTTEWLKATLALEQLRQKRRDLLNAANQEAKDQATGFSGFEFLQKTQGFASNLLGNLIPGFATGGLVGNTSAVQGQITDPTLGAGIERTTGFGTDGNRGVRPVQVDTTNALLRQILAALNGRQTNPVEIRRNRFTSDAVMDTI